MSALSSVQRAISGLATGLVDAARAFTTEDGFHEMAAALGWELEGLPAPMASVTVPARSLIEIADRITGDGDPSPSDLDAARTAIVSFVTAVQALDHATFDAGLETLTEFGRELLDYSVLEYLFRENRLVLHALRVLGIVRISYQPASGRRGSRIRREILWSNLGRIFVDPAAAYREAYGWGTRELDSRGILDSIQDLLCTMRWPAGLQRLDPRIVDVLAERSPDALNRNDLAVTIRFLDRMVDDQAVAAGLRILELPGTASRLPAIAVVPFIAGDVGEKFAIDDHVDGALSASAELQGGIALRLSPEDGLSLVIGANDPATATAGVARISASIDVHDPAKLPKTLLAVEGGFRFDVTTLVGRAGASVDSNGEKDLYLELELPDAQLTLGSGGGDPLTPKVVPAGAAMKLRLGIGFSTKRGVYFLGGTGLQARIPVDVSIGPLSCEAVELSLGLDGDGVAFGIATTLALEVGPVKLTLEGLGARMRIARADNGNFGPVDLSVAPLPPHGIAIAVSGELVSGGGSIDRTAPGTYLGGIALRVAAFQVSATALLESMPDGYSFACVLGATFPSIPLFAGFTLDGIGGALMLHRTIGEDALRAKLRTGTSFLFPDPKEIAASARELHDLFPARRGRHVLGPAVRLGWGAPSMVQADLAVLVEVPLPIKVALIGAIEVGLPSLEQRIVNLRIDLLGVVDFGRRTIAFDASLHDSTIAGYELGGDAAMRLRWGDDPTFLVAMGGFHPRFQPPADLPALRRLALTIGDNPRLRLDAYLAITASTFQMGSHVDLRYQAGNLAISGHLAFDVLIEVNPLLVDAELLASVSITYRGHSIASARLSFTLTGPRPWRAKGDATIGFLWWDVSVGFDVRWGEGAQESLPPPPDVAALVASALGERSAWTTELPAGERPCIVFGDRDAMHPLGALVVSQRVAPLDHPIGRYANQPLPAVVVVGSPSVHIGSGNPSSTPTTETFAPGQFNTMSEAELLGGPSFERMTSGLRCGSGVSTLGPVTIIPMDDVTIVDDAFAPNEPPSHHSVSVDLLAAFAALRGRAVGPSPAIQIRPPRYVLASVETLQPAGAPSTFAALAQRMRGTPGARLQIVRESELVRES